MSATAPVSGLVHGMSDAEYHSLPHLSSTGARRILDSPARFRYEQDHPRTSLAFDIGTAVHTKVLGTGAPAVTYPEEHLTPSGSVSTKAATVAWMDEQRAAGRIVLGSLDYARAGAMAEAVLAHKGARVLLEQPGLAEMSAFATDPDTGVNVRARFDYLPDLFESPDAATVDLKTTSGSASQVGFGRDAAKYGYPIQEAHYTDVLEWVTGNRPSMAFVVVEKKPPHLVAVHYFDEITRMVARDLAAKARVTYAECVATNTWRGYGDEPLITQVPGWWLDQAEVQDEMEVA